MQIILKWRLTHFATNIYCSFILISHYPKAPYFVQKYKKKNIFKDESLFSD